MKKLRYVLLTAILMAITPIIAVSQVSQQPKTNDLDMAKLLGKTSYSSIIAPQNFKAEGVDLVKGRPLSEGMTLINTGKLGNLSPEEVLKAAGKELNLNGPLSQIESLKQISLESVVTANPEIANLKASAIGWAEKGEATLAELANTDIGKLPLPGKVLDQNTVTSFGNIAKTPIGNYPGVNKMPLSKLPEFAKAPIAKLMSAIPTGPNIRLMRVNKVFTGQKNGSGFSTKVVTGSDQRPKAQWDKGTPVSGVELIDVMSPGKGNPANGSVAITGSSLMIPGGNVPSPNQPTALPIPGTPLALSIESPDAKKGDAAVQLNMRMELAFGLKTSYFIPIPTGIRVSEASKSTLIPVEFALPDSIANGNKDVNISSSTRKSTIAPSVDSANTVGSVKQSQGVASQSSVTQSEEAKEIAKNNEIGSAVKGATDPVAGVVY